MSILISCEAAGEMVPRQLVDPSAAVGGMSASELNPLPSQLSCDTAAGYAARRISSCLSAPLIQHEYSLDLIDVTRSLRHRHLFSSLTRPWPPSARQWLIDHLHQPYRDRVRSAIGQMLLKFPTVIHVSIRTFPLRYKHKRRRADVGLLYDPAEREEVDLCVDWLEEMYFELPMLRVRRNYPRRGTTDSLTKSMRAEFAGQAYLGIEVLLNEHWVTRELAVRDEAIDGMCQTLQDVIGYSQADAA